jgi:hypothetical protein
MIRTSIVFFTVAAMGLATGCVNVMNGTVDGHEVGPARTALFAELDTEISDVGVDGNLLMVSLSGLESNTACEAMKESMDIDWSVGCEDACADSVAISEQYFRQSEYWIVDLTLLPQGDAVTAYEHGDIWDFVSGDPAFSGGLSWAVTSEATDLDTCIEMCEDFDSYDSYWEADGGSVEVTDYSAGDELAGSFDIDFDGDPVSGEFKAQFCDYAPDYDIF